ncbi:MAG: response regulator [Spirochaetaceae bacterium]|nr:response regulator [Spirochaetaceae bacterium]
MTRVLVVDDEPMIGALVSGALANRHFETTVVNDIKSAEKVLEQANTDVLVCDINLDSESGMVLIDHERVRNDRVAVVVMSGSADLPVAMDVIHRGAFDFVAKPFSSEELLRAVNDAKNRRNRELAEQERRLELEFLVRERTEELSTAFGAVEEAYDRTIEALGAALDLRDTETEQHCRNVAEMSLRIASAYGINDPLTLRDLRWGALLHDIGKIGIPDAILRKPGPLTAEERKIVNTHPVLGARLIGEIDFLSGAITIVRHHHERYDGTGYPDGLTGEEIPLLARIFAVTDAVDVLIGGRVYQSALTLQEVREEVARSAGTHFDPTVVGCFLSLELGTQGFVA